MFNHQARWDRKLPEEDPQKPGDKISVNCLIEAGRVEPRAFLWHQKTYPIDRINFQWRDRQGREEVRLYSVSTPQGTFEIAFFTQALVWKVLCLISP